MFLEVMQNWRFFGRGEGANILTILVHLGVIHILNTSDLIPNLTPKNVGQGLGPRPSFWKMSKVMQKK